MGQLSSVSPREGAIWRSCPRRQVHCRKDTLQLLVCFRCARITASAFCTFIFSYICKPSCCQLFACFFWPLLLVLFFFFFCTNCKHDSWQIVVLHSSYTHQLQSMRIPLCVCVCDFLLFFKMINVPFLSNQALFCHTLLMWLQIFSE